MLIGIFKRRLISFKNINKHLIILTIVLMQNIFVYSINIETYISLKVGNKMEYQISSGGIIMRFDQTIVDQKYGLVGEGTIDYKAETRVYYNQSNQGNPNTSITGNVLVFSISERGIKQYTIDTLTNNVSEEYLLKNPIKIGTKWLNNNRISEIVSTSSTIKTAAGYFSKCIVVKDKACDTDEIYSLIYYAPNIGLVKKTICTKNGKEIPGLELINYNLK